ncbi:MAG: response regulator [Cyanophyceae cyanobacterium]
MFSTDSCILGLNLINLLKNLSGRQFCGCITGESKALTWRLYFHQGKISYATNSIAPFERVKRYLYSLSNQNLRLVSVVSTLQTHGHSTDLLVICWLLERGLVRPEIAKVLVREMARETLESLLLSPIAPDIHYSDARCPFDYQIEFSSLLAECQARLQQWTALLPTIESPFQRPFLVHPQSLASDRRLQRLRKVLTGFSFRQLAVLLKQDECLIAQRMQPLIAQKLIGLKAPQPPFDRLPSLATLLQGGAGSPTPHQEQAAPVVQCSSADQQKQWQIVCIDDSPAAIRQIEEFLQELELSLIKFSEPVKALLEISKLQPDLILLDVGMPNIDGYSLCSLLRKNSLLKTTPIVMVTGYQGLINQTKADFVGATDYLTKPFTQSELVAVVLKHINSS